MENNLDPIYQITRSELKQMQARLDSAEKLIEQLQRENERNQLDNASLAHRLDSASSRLATAEKLIEFLWQIIDDIDTYSDMAKFDDKAFRSMVERRQKDRWKTWITTDGYTLNLDEAIAAAKQWKEQ